MYLLNILIVFVFYVDAFLASEECSKETGDWYKYHLGTKTPYRIVANTTASKPDFKGCKAKKIWMLVRHGTRNPNGDKIINMQTRLPKIRDLILKHNSKPNEFLRFSDLYNLANWKIDIPIAEKSFLKREGEYEAIELAERMQFRYPELFPPTFRNETYLFKITTKQRTEATAKYFAAGLFGRDNISNVFIPKPLDNDPILEFYKLCQRWISEVEQNPETVRERIMFDNSSHMVQMVKKINKVLNFKNQVLSLGDITLMYIACTFETAWNEVRKSPWCSVFDAESLKAMEYREILENYYIDGYGTELNYKQACPTFGDMFNFFKGNTKYPQTVLYFTHSGALAKVLAHLGLYKDKKPPKHDNFDSNKRKWRPSKITAFATNLAFVLFDCKEEKMVALYHQERLVKLPSCEKELCSLEDIKKYYKHSIQDCNFDAMCGITR